MVCNPVVQDREKEGCQTSSQCSSPFLLRDGGMACVVRSVHNLYQIFQLLSPSESVFICFLGVRTPKRELGEGGGELG